MSASAESILNTHLEFCLIYLHFPLLKAKLHDYFSHLKVHANICFDCLSICASDNLN